MKKKPNHLPKKLRKKRRQQEGNLRKMQPRAR